MGTSTLAAYEAAPADKLYWSPNNIIYDMKGDKILQSSGCKARGDITAAYKAVDPEFMEMHYDADVVTTKTLDPRPAKGGNAYKDVDVVPAGFDTTAYKGAFGDDIWLTGWSLLHTSSQLRPNDALPDPTPTPGPA